MNPVTYNDYNTLSLIMILKKRGLVVWFFFIKGERLNNLLITVGNTGTENFCGYFGKTASTADQILIYCEDGTVGRYVMATISSNQGKLDMLNICEFQVFVKWTNNNLWKNIT